MSRADLVAEIALIPEHRRFGRITGVMGKMLEAGGLPHRLGVGGQCTVLAQDGRRLPCEVVGVRAGRALLMPSGDVGGVGLGGKVEPTDRPPAIQPSDGWLGRVVNAVGEPIDGKGPLPLGPAAYLLRAGPGTGQGSITGLFTVLVEGDDHNEPIADATRSILDGHIVLDRAIAERGRFPAINVLRSISRTMPGCNTAAENAVIAAAQAHLSTYEDMAELIRLGAYKRGSDAKVDEATKRYPLIEAFLAQGKTERADLASRYAQLTALLAAPR